MHSTYNQAKRLKTSVDLCASDPSMASFSNVSSKYKDIISKSLLLRSGPPSIYQLKPKKEIFGTLTPEEKTDGNLKKLTVGEKDVNKINKTILLVGETGTGKSTLINALVNHIMGVEWEDEVWFKIVEEEERSQTESQTPDVIVYQVCGFEGETLPYSLTIIDTPGFGDTKGVEHDNVISERLFDLFRSPDGVHEINAVGLVMKAGVNRLSDRLLYIFDSVMSLFGKGIEKNIVALITHSSGGNPKNVLKALKAAEIQCARNEKNQPVYFLFNIRQHEDQTEEEEEEEEEESELETAWRRTDRGMKQFMTFLEKTGPQKLNTTVEVLNERVRLAACIQNLQERIKTIELKQKAIRQTEEALKKHEEEKKKPEEFIVEVDQPYRGKQSIEGGWRWFGGYNGAVTCNVCEENCHHPGCTIAWSPARCEVMKGGRCTSCTRRCHVSDHVKEMFIYVDRTRKVKKTLEDMKQQYERQYQADKKEKSSLLENLKTEMNHLEVDKTRWLEEAYQHVVNLNQIALKADSVSTYVHLDFLIEKMKEKGDRRKVQKLEEMKKEKHEDTRLRAAVKYMWSRMTSAGKAMTGLMKGNPSV